MYGNTIDVSGTPSHEERSNAAIASVELTRDTRSWEDILPYASHNGECRTQKWQQAPHVDGSIVALHSPLSATTDQIRTFLHYALTMEMAHSIQSGGERGQWESDGEKLADSDHQCESAISELRHEDDHIAKRVLERERVFIASICFYRKLCMQCICKGGDLHAIIKDTAFRPTRAKLQQRYTKAMSDISDVRHSSPLSSVRCGILNRSVFTQLQTLVRKLRGSILSANPNHILTQIKPTPNPSYLYKTPIHHSRSGIEADLHSINTMLWERRAHDGEGFGGIQRDMHTLNNNIDQRLLLYQDGHPSIEGRPVAKDALARRITFLKEQLKEVQNAFENLQK